MDRMADSGSADMGSIPVGGTAKRVEALLLPVFFIPSFSLSVCSARLALDTSLRSFGIPPPCRGQ